MSEQGFNNIFEHSIQMIGGLSSPLLSAGSGYVSNAEEIFSSRTVNDNK